MFGDDDDYLCLPCKKKSVEDDIAAIGKNN